ncbi:MAG: rhamnulokinase family protein [Cellulomonas sp.]
MASSPSARTAALAAVDLGASSGRVVVGRVGPDILDLHEVTRFENAPVHLPDGLHWDIVGLYHHAFEGLRAAVHETHGQLASVAVDTWAVDYGLLRHGSLLGTPFHYRDSRTAAGVELVHDRVPFERLYGLNGLQFLPFNTIYQLAAEPLLDVADGLLLVPDLIGYWLTGRQVAERTNASTTGLLDARSGQWSEGLLDAAGVDRGLLPDLADPGTRLGPVRDELLPFLGTRALDVTLVGSHDTASAVVGVPMTSDSAAWISCGTWGLVGLELDAPVITDASRAANFTNEGGVDGRTRFLTNVMGTWLLSETLRTWERADGTTPDLGVLLRAAQAVEPRDVAVFDVQDPRFVPPGDVPARITAWCDERGLRSPADKPAIVRSIVESLAQGFADALGAAAALSGRRVDLVHVVGGGSLNDLLCQATADRSERPVLAGPVEATAIGNLVVQARSVGALSGTLEDLRELVARTHEPRRFDPKSARVGS